MIEPNTDAIKAHLTALFGLAQSEYPGGLIELRYGPPDALDNWAYFNLQSGGIDDASSFAQTVNRLGQNVYVGVNPRRPNTNTKRAASANDIEIAFFHFADIDKAESVNGLVERYGALPPTMNVTTGTVPNKRPHLYWQLEEPVRNMAEWTKRQKGIAQSLGGDAVIDPPRIMRLAGTVNYPTQKKLAKGYKVELSSLRTEFANERSPVTPDQISTTYPEQATVSEMETVQTGQTTLSAMSPGGKTRRLIDAALSGNNWHDNVRDLTSRLARLGRTTDEILLMAPGLTLPGFAVNDTVADMRKMLAGARAKYFLPEPADADDLEDDEEIFVTMSLDEIEAMPPPTWLVEGLIADHGLSIVYGDPGAGKSFITLDMALRLSYGMDWHGTTTKQTGVLYIAGEGARGLGKRVKGWRREHALEGAEAPFLLLPVAVPMLEPSARAKLCRTIQAAIERAGFPIGLVVIDTVSRSIAGQDENGQESMSLFVDACAEIQQFIGGAVIAVHHSGKDKEKGMRGSSVLLGGCDASIRITKNAEIVTIKTEKQKDDEEAAPIYMTMKKIEWATGFEKEESTLVPFKREAPAIETRTLSRIEVDETFNIVAQGWNEKTPWSCSSQAKRRGRYLPEWMSERFEITHDQALGYVMGWQQRDYLKNEICDMRNKVSGLKVIRYLEPDQ